MQTLKKTGVQMYFKCVFTVFKSVFWRATFVYSIQFLFLFINLFYLLFGLIYEGALLIFTLNNGKMEFDMDRQVGAMSPVLQATYQTVIVKTELRCTIKQLSNKVTIEWHLTIFQKKLRNIADKTYQEFSATNLPWINGRKGIAGWMDVQLEYEEC